MHLKSSMRNLLILFISAISIGLHADELSELSKRIEGYTRSQVSSSRQVIATVGLLEGVDFKKSIIPLISAGILAHDVLEVIMGTLRNYSSGNAEYETTIQYRLNQNKNVPALSNLKSPNGSTSFYLKLEPGVDKDNYELSAKLGANTEIFLLNQIILEIGNLAKSDKEKARLALNGVKDLLLFRMNLLKNLMTSRNRIFDNLIVTAKAYAQRQRLIQLKDSPEARYHADMSSEEVNEQLERIPSNPFLQTTSMMDTARALLTKQADSFQNPLENATNSGEQLSELSAAYLTVFRSNNAFIDSKDSATIPTTISLLDGTSPDMGRPRFDRISEIANRFKAPYPTITPQDFLKCWTLKGKVN